MTYGLHLATTPPVAVATTAAGLQAIDSLALHAVIRERLDQVERHGYDAAHDDAHDQAEIGRGALAYLVAGIREERGDGPDIALDSAAEIWPFEIAGLRPTDYAGNLIKAAAMCIAEADRIIRARGLLDYADAGHAVAGTGGALRVDLPQLLDVADRLSGGCRVCGCTDDRACVNDGVPCHWVEPDLCSACCNPPTIEDKE